MWRPSIISPLDAGLMQRVREKYDLKPLVIHSSYLINLASSDEKVRGLSVQGFRGELERAKLIGAEYLVVHPGNHKGVSLEEGMANVVQSLSEASEGFEPGITSILLECTAGAGNSIGSKFLELHAIREVAANMIPVPLGYCLDTCHMFASGYDLANESGVKEMVRDAETILGWDHIKAIHSNDSKGALGSHIDRHENIGKGLIGREGFRRLLAHPKLRKLPFIMETPVESDEDCRRDIETLRELCPRSSTTTTRSS